MTDQPAEIELDIRTLAVTQDGEPTPEIRALLADEGWTIWPTARRNVAQLLPEPPQLQELTVVVPLLDQARELLNREVLVIVDGARLDGRLLAVDDEALVLTIEDQAHRFYVAVDTIAVLGVKR